MNRNTASDVGRSASHLARLSITASKVATVFERKSWQMKHTSVNYVPV